MDRRNVEIINVVLIGGYAHGKRIAVDSRACNVSVPHAMSLGIVQEQYWARRIDGGRRIYAHATLSTARAVELAECLASTMMIAPFTRALDGIMQPERDADTRRVRERAHRCVS